MEYKLVKVDNNIYQNFSLMSISDAKNYFNWFMSVKEERLNYFSKEVLKKESTILTIDDLDKAEAFLKNSIFHKKIKNKTDLIIDTSFIDDLFKPYLTLGDRITLQPTNSILFDISILFGEIVIKNNKGLIWNLEKTKRSFFYGRPMIQKRNFENQAELCPRQVIGVVASQIIENRFEGSLKSVCNFWIDCFDKLVI